MQIEAALGVSSEIMHQSKIGFVGTCITLRRMSPRSRLTRDLVQKVLLLTQRVKAFRSEVKAEGRGGVNNNNNGCAVCWASVQNKVHS